ncbi:hypothetical protein JCM10212_005506 [Sporobolomyces blumeae]
MASLNWALVAPSTRRPVPLPSEKFVSHLTAVSLSLFPHSPGSSPSAAPADPATERKSDKGDVYLSNQRIVFVSPAPTSPSARGGALETLSIPYSHVVDGRLVQPWFTANYYEGICVPARDGGLDGPHVIRLYFKEGGAFDFYTHVVEMKERLGSAAGTSTANEQLPLYTPQIPNTGSSSASSARPSPSSTVPPSPTIRTPARRPSRTAPSDSDLDVARVAQAAQARERDEEEAELRTGRFAPPSVSSARSNPASPSPAVLDASRSSDMRDARPSAPPPIGDDPPPSYEA